MKGVFAIFVIAACGRIGFDGHSRDAMTSEDVLEQFADGKIETPDAAPGTVTRISVGDTSIRSMNLSGNPGTTTVIQVGQTGSQAADTRALVQFDLAGVTAPVSAATLRLVLTLSSGTAVIDIGVYRVTQAWDEGTASWNNATQQMSWPPGGAFAATPYAVTTVAPAMFRAYDWDVTNLVNEWLASTPNDGLLLRYVSAPATPAGLGFRSREFGPGSEPELLIAP